ncbi:MAG: nuclease [Gammaproteobacteria bacterium]|nr:nuclease [Gammaproteobacteria bacterium]
MKMIFAAILLLLLAFCTGGSTGYDVKRVIDGDTVAVDIDGQLITVRLLEVDAPELAQPYGKEAKQALSDLLLGKPVRLLAEKRKQSELLYARVFFGEMDVNAWLVEYGHAWIDRKHSTDSNLPRLEKKAHADKRGLWREPNPMPPWEYRRQHAKNGDGS